MTRALGQFVLNYFAGHQTRVNQVLRLRRGQSIGSGLVEGSIKQLLNVRMKQTGARWKVEHVAPLVELGALAAGPEWDAFWKQRLNQCQNREGHPSGIRGFRG